MLLSVPEIVHTCLPLPLWAALRAHRLSSTPFLSYLHLYSLWISVDLPTPLGISHPFAGSTHATAQPSNEFHYPNSSYTPTTWTNRSDISAADRAWVPESSLDDEEGFSTSSSLSWSIWTRLHCGRRGSRERSTQARQNLCESSCHCPLLFLLACIKNHVH